MKPIRSVFKYNVCSTIIIYKLPDVTTLKSQGTETFYIALIAVRFVTYCNPYTGKFIIPAIQVEVHDVLF